jgi:hypothetical protein
MRSTETTEQQAFPRKSMQPQGESPSVFLTVSNELPLLRCDSGKNFSVLFELAHVLHDAGCSTGSLGVQCCDPRGAANANANRGRHVLWCGTVNSLISHFYSRLEAPRLFHPLGWESGGCVFGAEHRAASRRTFPIEQLAGCGDGVVR